MQHVSIKVGLKCLLSLCCGLTMSSSFADSSGPLALKGRSQLGLVKSGPVQLPLKSETVGSLLASLEMFRGVAVESTTTKEPGVGNVTLQLDQADDKSPTGLKMIHGGLQFSLQENLSVIYSPGRLAGSALNAESQGLYLLGNQGGPVNWFVGLESGEYFNQNTARRESNTTHFGVILSLD